MKKLVRREEKYFSLYDLDGKTVEEIMTELKELPSHWELDVRISGDYENDSFFVSMVEETDEQYETRIVEEQRRETYQRLQYERLKSKFENGSK